MKCCVWCEKELPRVPVRLLRHDADKLMPFDMELDKEFCSIDCLLIWALMYSMGKIVKGHEERYHTP